MRPLRSGSCAPQTGFPIFARMSACTSDVASWAFRASDKAFEAEKISQELSASSMMLFSTPALGMTRAHRRVRVGRSGGRVGRGGGLWVVRAVGRSTGRLMDEVKATRSP